MKKSSIIGNKKLSDFSELRNMVISHVIAMKKLRK
tara:strand:- start:15630 stop:15734 length:105 start_codon:yes stop_codon:yes gene_type:complete